jgi:flagellar hook-basal body complex protein FliE
MDVGRADINNLLSQMRELKAQAQGPANVGGTFSARPNELSGGQSASAPEFSQLFKNAVNTVQQAQDTSKALATAYEQGQPGVSLSQVMVASQKSSVSFEAMTQVRNKLVEAYQDVMNMPI